MKNLGIKAKLIFIFIILKVIPIILITFLFIKSVDKIEQYFENINKETLSYAKQSISSAINISIKDSIKALDKKSQDSLEKLSVMLANQIAQFLYERDKDILFLSKLNIDQNVLKSFYQSKTKNIIVPPAYIYSDKENKWIPKVKKDTIKLNIEVNNSDNKKNFHIQQNNTLNLKQIPIYKEVSFFNLKGEELYKISQINNKKLDISKRSNTYIGCESYFNKIGLLKKGEIYVSDVIGEYVPSKLIGTFSKPKAKKMGIKFEPKKYGYAGVENPVGKKFKAIIRYITPVFRDGKKVGYISTAVDFDHIKQFINTTNPINANLKQSIADASTGNYAFLWDSNYRNIVHPREYFIVGFNKKTKKRETPWLSKEIAEDFKNSSFNNIDDFLKQYPIFKNQSLKQKPNIAQLKADGNIALDCRYLNFAPQCQGWAQVVKDGGFGSFIIYWSKLWKLVTAATVPYYTGQYGKNKRGFGFVTIGANVDEFHKAASNTKQNVQKISNNETLKFEQKLKVKMEEVKNYIKNSITNQIFVMILLIIIVIVIAIYIANYLTKRILIIIDGTEKFAHGDLDYKIKIDTNDEIGALSKAFNTMSYKIKSLINHEKELNETLEDKVRSRTSELETNFKQLQQAQEQLVKSEKMASLGELVAGVAHEINTPVGTALTGVSHIYDETSKIEKLYKSDNISEDEFVSYIQTTKDISYSVEINLQKAADLIKSFKQVAIDQSSENIRLFNLKIYLKEVIISLHNQLKKKKHKIELDISSDIELFLNPGLISQIFTNLIMNSIIHGFKNKENGIICIKAYKKDNNLTIVYKDDGEGISSKIEKKIFNPFFTTNRTNGGSGLGMNIVHNIITQQLDGTIYLNSNVNSGVEFIINIPIK